MRHGVIAVRLVLALLVITAGAMTGCTRAAVKPTQQTATPTETVATTSTGESNPQTDKVTVPDVVSRGMTSARMVLGANHLTYEVVTDPPGSDLPMDNSVTVIKQDPEPDAVVDSGSTVIVTIKAK